MSSIFREVSSRLYPLELFQAFFLRISFSKFSSLINDSLSGIRFLLIVNFDIVFCRINVKLLEVL